jgi:broad specificity phosphatase PhoE
MLRGSYSRGAARCAASRDLTGHHPIADAMSWASVLGGEPDVRADGLSGHSWQRESVRLFIFARHAESSANVAGVVSSDPARSVGLTARGVTEAGQLGEQVANLDVELAICTRLLRTQQTLEVALRGRPVPVLIDPGFDEIRTGDLDGEPIEGYWSWKEHHTGRERFPHGESEDEALIRYANALRRLLSRTETVTLLIVHGFALRHIVAAATTSLSRSKDPPSVNALPYLLDQRAIERASAGLEASARSELRSAAPRSRGVCRTARR